jgi:hypothetical protein
VTDGMGLSGCRTCPVTKITAHSLDNCFALIVPSSSWRRCSSRNLGPLNGGPLSFTGPSARPSMNRRLLWPSPSRALLLALPRCDARSVPALPVQDENGKMLPVFGNIFPNANGSATQGERAFTNSANRTVINSTVASTHNCQGVSCCQAEAPAPTTQPISRWGFCSLH